MSITVTGLILIILSIYSLFFRRDLLYKLSIFFLPFSATAVINLGEEGSGTAIQPYMFIGAIWIFSLLLFEHRKIKNIRINQKEALAISMLLGFALIALLSLYMPFSINGREMGNKTGELDELEPIAFTSKNITQYLYLIYGITFSICIYLYNRSQEKYETTIKLYAISVSFVIVWGLFELFCKQTGIPYPDFIFNNSYSKSGGGFMSVLEDGSNRISSVATEPSILSQSIVIFLPFLIISILNKRYILGKYKDVILAFTLLVFIVRSASGSGMLSLFLLLFLLFNYFLKSVSLVKRIIYLSLSILVVPIVSLLFYILFQDIIMESLFNKADSFSGIERLSAVIDAWNSFLQHPVLGLGWGSITSFDLFIRILANCGIAGLIFFVGYLATTTKNLMSAKEEDFPHKTAILISFVTLIFSNIISGFSYTFGYFWFIAGLAIVTSFKTKTTDR